MALTFNGCELRLLLWTPPDCPKALMLVTRLLIMDGWLRIAPTCDARCWYSAPIVLSKSRLSLPWPLWSLWWWRSKIFAKT